VPPRFLRDKAWSMGYVYRLVLRSDEDDRDMGWMSGVPSRRVEHGERGDLRGIHGEVLNRFAGVAIAWTISIAGTLIILFVVDKLIGLRVSEADERVGLDLSQYGEEGYDWEGG
jgi:ammonia channel protein AmtB